MSDWRTDTYRAGDTTVTRHMNVRTGETFTLDADQEVDAVLLGLILRRFLTEEEPFAEMQGRELVIDGRVTLSPAEVDLLRNAGVPSFDGPTRYEVR